MRLKKEFFIIVICVLCVFYTDIAYGEEVETYFQKLEIPSNENIEIVSVLTNVKNLNNIRVVKGVKSELDDFTVEEYIQGLLTISDGINTTHYGDYYQIVLKGKDLDTSLNYFIATKGYKNEDGENFMFIPTSSVIRPEFGKYEVNVTDGIITINWSEVNGANSEKTNVSFSLVKNTNIAVGEKIGENLPTNGTLKYTIPNSLDTDTYYVRGLMERPISEAEVYKDTVVSDGISFVSGNSPNQVTALTAKDMGNKKVAFSWKALDLHPNKYYLEVVNETGNISYIDVEGDCTEVTSTNFGVGNYSVKVYGTKVVNERTYTGEYSESVDFVISPPSPPDLSLSFNSEGDIVDRYLTQEGETYIQKYINNSSLKVSGTANKNAKIEIYVNDELRDTLYDQITFVYDFEPFKDGAYNVIIKAYSDKEDISQYYYDFEVDTIKPYLEVLTPLNGDRIDNTFISVKGQSEPSSTVKVNGITIDMDSKGFFDYDLLPSYSLSNEVEVVVSDNAKNETRYKAFLKNETHEISNFAIKSEKDTMYVDETQLVYGVATDVIFKENILLAENVNFEMVSGEDIISVDEKGLITPIKTGVATIKATFSLTNDKIFEGEVTIKVIERPQEPDPNTPQEPVPSKPSSSNNRRKGEKEINEKIEEEVINEEIVTIKINNERGGQLKIGEDVEVDIPSFANKKDIRLEGKKLRKEEVPLVTNKKITRISDVIQINSSGSGIFEKPIKLSFNIQKKENKKDENYAIYYYNEEKEKWIFIGGEFSNGKFIAEINHLTKFAVFYKDDLSVMNDIEHHWAKKYIKTLIGREIINGISNREGSYSYLPDKDITRAEFAKLITSLMEYDIVSEYNASLGDYDEIPSWSMQYMQTLLNEGILEGEVIDHIRYLRPNRKITREEIVTVLSRLYEYTPKTTHQFTDSESVSHWADENLSKMVGLDVINGRPDGSFSPKSNATRAECAKILSRMIDVIERQVD